MINKAARLDERVFGDELKLIATRQGYGEGLVAAGEADERVVVLSADLTESTRSNLFKEKYPDRFIQIGVAEQLLATLAAGMANYGKIPFISSYAAFSPGRNWEQIRTTIALNNVPVKIAGAHAGISVGPDGATHQQLEDIALMRAMPNMMVVVPADSIETRKATEAIAKNNRPAYIRFARHNSPVFTTLATPFELGKAVVLWESKQPLVALVGCGPLVYEALLAANALEKDGVGSVVLNSHTVDPLDEAAIVRVAKKAGAVVSIEEHQIKGGLGGAIAETLARESPVPIEFVGMDNSFGESGETDELLTKYHLNAPSIIAAAKKVITRK
jgi:transketolase